MLTMQERMNLSVEYAMFNQSNLTCYWCNREELSAKQRAIIKDLGYAYRGKHNWLYFISYEPGYYPYNLSQDEVIRMTEHLENLEVAFTYYKETDTHIHFDGGNMFSFVYSADKKTWNFGEKPLPFTSYNFGNLVITDESLLDIYDAAIEEYADLIVGEMLKQYHFQGKSLKEVLELMSTQRTVGLEAEQGQPDLYRLFHEPGSKKLHDQLSLLVGQKLVPVVTGLLEQAKARGEIHLSDLKAAAYFIVFGQVGILMDSSMSGEEQTQRIENTLSELLGLYGIL